MIVDLSIGLIERLGLIVVCAFLLSKTTFFKSYVVKKEASIKEKWFFGIFWGVLGILMTQLGTPVSGGIANSRTIPVLLSGIIGGPLVGSVSGMIAGIHRMFFAQGGDLTALSCGISTIIAGFVGGYSKKMIDSKTHKHLYGFALGIIVEVIQMFIILLIARPFDEAYALVKIIFIPMTFLNAIGVGMFLLFIKQIFDEHELASAKMAQLSLEIARLTLPNLKKGLSSDSAVKAVNTIYELTDYSAVAMKKNDALMAYSGNEETFLSSYASQFELEDGAVGTLIVFKEKANALVKGDVELVNGLANLFESQIALARIARQKKLRAEAELNALRAQIKPHFLFNALNAIMALTRTDPEKARKLLGELSIVLRGGFKNNEAFIELSEELRYVDAYLRIEQARFPEKLKVRYLIDEKIHMKLPPLLLQPLIENAVKHGIQKKKENGEVCLKIQREENEILFQISDDGIGISKDLLNGEIKTKGIGLENVKKRLKSIYGTDLNIQSIENQGTVIDFKLPLAEVDL